MPKRSPGKLLRSLVLLDQAVAPRIVIIELSDMPAWPSRVAKSTATIKNRAIKIRSVVVDMATPLLVCA
jgi:hypothetical protein